MSTPIEDFIVSLGFDTSKIASQVQAIHKQLEGLAVKTDKVRVASGLAAQKQISDNEIKQTKKTVAAKEKIETKADKARIEREKQTAKMIGETRRQAALRQLRNQIAEAERNTTGPSNLSQRYKYYEKGKASIAKINAFTEQLRGSNTDTRNRLKASGLLSSFDSSSAARDRLNMSRVKGNLDVARLRMSKLGLSADDFDRRVAGASTVSDMKQILQDARNIVALQKELMRTQKVTVAAQVKSAKLQRGPNQTDVQAYAMMLQQQGRIPSRALAEQIQRGAMQQSTQKGAEQYINQAAKAARYSSMGLGNSRETNNILASGNRQALSDLNNQLSAAHAQMKAIERRSIGAAAAMGGMRDSARNMVREMASVYAILAGTGYIKESAKAMDGMQAGMVAVSATADEAAQSIKFITDEALKNGLSIKEASKDYVKLKAAIGDKLELKETEEMFQALTKAGVVFQLSQDDMSGVIRAVSQMFAKGKIQAEEFRSQLGDRAPIAMRALEKSTGKTSAELEKMMEQGKLTTEYIKPLVMAMGELATANGAYEKALTKLGTVENRLKTTSQLASARVAEAGFTKGLINLYETLMKSMNENGETLERIGKIYEKVFNGLASLVRVVTKYVETFVRSLETLWKVFQWGVANPFEGLIASLFTLKGLMLLFPKLFAGLGAAIVAVLSGPLAIVTAIMGTLDEVRAIFDENLIGLGENDKASYEDRKIAAANARVSAGFGSKEDEALISGLSKERVRQAQVNAGGAAQYFGYMSMNPLKNFGDNLGDKAFRLVQSAKELGGFNQTIIVQGNMTEDNVRQISEESQKVMDRWGMMNSVGFR